MADVRETFENLKSRLKATGLLPDEDFLFDGEYDTQLQFIRFATGKTLEESRDAFLRMHRIAGECTLMLNGRGFYYGRSEGSKIHDWPEELLSQMAPDTMRVLFPYQEEGELSFSIIPERLNNLADYAN